jgi:glycerol kinase
MLDLNAGREILWGGGGVYPLALWQRDGVLEFCLEGTAITAGAAVTWLRDGLGIIGSPEESGTLAASVPDTGGVWVIPALQGLGTPYLEPNARAVVGGIPVRRRARTSSAPSLEGVAWRCRQVYEALRADCPHPAPTVLRADGGMARKRRALAGASGCTRHPDRATRRARGGGARRGVSRRSRDRRLDQHRRSRPGVAM